MARYTPGSTGIQLGFAEQKSYGCSGKRLESRDLVCKLVSFASIFRKECSLVFRFKLDVLITGQFKLHSFLQYGLKFES